MYAQRLKEEGKLWCIYNAEKKDDVLFLQDSKPLISLNQDLIDFWHTTKVSLAMCILQQTLSKRL